MLNIKPEPITQRTLPYLLNHILKPTPPLTHIHPHNLTHTFPTHLFNQPPHLTTLQSLLPHLNFSTTPKYTHLS
ncbi:tyrosine-type recombinase/integrase, partial [Staphylococcus aureus]|uniref:tyrosine-type recombinase/integrase n=1 Tax=Staphylococcus aureus TaxID=1280 RepID=UPI00119EC828